MSEDLAGQVAAVRAFNRFYTNVIGLVHGMYLDMPYSLTEARLLYEMARRDVTRVADLRRALDIDAGYLSRVLGRFEADGLVTRQRSAADARRQDVALTSAGLAAAAELDARSDSQVGELLAGVDRPRVLTAMREITDLLSADGADASPRVRTVVLRPPAPGDLGWVLQRHGAVYAAEYGWNSEFEAYVARIIADYLTDTDPRRAAGWVAELDGVPVGFVCCVPEDDSTARLRLLLVESWGRGLGIGGGWSTRCCGSPGRPATNGSCCPPSASSPAPGESISGPASRSCASSPSAATGTTSSPRTGRDRSPDSGGPRYPGVAGGAGRVDVGCP